MVNQESFLVIKKVLGLFEDNLTEESKTPQLSYLSNLIPTQTGNLGIPVLENSKNLTSATLLM